MQINMDKASATSLIRQRMDEGKQLAESMDRQSDADGWAAKLEHSLERMLDDDQWISKFRHRRGAVATSNPARNVTLARENVLRTVEKLSSLLDIIAESDDSVSEAKAQPVSDIDITNRVFLVHGRADSIKNEVARFLERLGLDVVILHERPNKGRTLITKFQEESSDVSFAVVLVTPDDMGGAGR